MDICKVGILGAGNIASTMAKTLAAMPEAQAYAIGSRDIERAQQFAQEHDIPKAYTYTQLVQDPAIDLVYIATPHSHHAEHAILCLEHGKPVLCEKSFTANASQAKDVLTLAKQKNLLVTEAIWTRYTPLAKTLQELLAKGAIGTPSMLSANLGWPLADIARMAQPALAGGALLDLGIYTLTFASIAFGHNVKKIDSSVVKWHTGVDAANTITLTYENDKIATLYSDMRSCLDGRGTIYGSEGWIEVPQITNFEHIRIVDNSRNEVALIQPPANQISGYEYEVRACISALQDGRIECPEMPHSETIRIMEIMDALRQSWHISFPFESSI